MEFSRASGKLPILGVGSDPRTRPTATHFPPWMGDHRLETSRRHPCIQPIVKQNCDTFDIAEGQASIALLLVIPVEDPFSAVIMHHVWSRPRSRKTAGVPECDVPSGLTLTHLQWIPSFSRSGALRVPGSRSDNDRKCARWSRGSHLARHGVGK